MFKSIVTPKQKNAPSFIPQTAYTVEADPDLSNGALRINMAIIDYKMLTKEESGKDLFEHIHDFVEEGRRFSPEKHNYIQCYRIGLGLWQKKQPSINYIEISSPAEYNFENDKTENFTHRHYSIAPIRMTEEDYNYMHRDETIQNDECENIEEERDFVRLEEKWYANSVISDNPALLLQYGAHNVLSNNAFYSSHFSDYSLILQNNLNQIQHSHRCSKMVNAHIEFNAMKSPLGLFNATEVSILEHLPKENRTSREEVDAAVERLHRIRIDNNIVLKF